MRLVTLLLIVVSAALPCLADTYIVDQNGLQDFNTIQEAINYSWHGDTIIVNPGIYNENVYFNSRAITLTSTDPNDTIFVEATIIEPSTGHSVIFDFGENYDSVLIGFTIKRGIRCYGSSPTIKKNIIGDNNGYGIEGEYGASPIIVQNTIKSNGNSGICRCDGSIINNLISGNNTANNYSGGGLFYCDGTIYNNTISGNSASQNGGGLYECDGTISNNTISGNSAGYSGGGLYRCDGTISNNTITGNSASQGGALSNCNASIYNNIITFNKANSTGGIYNGSCLNYYNNLWMNEGENWGGGATAGVGDICVDPRFAENGYWTDPCNTPEDFFDDVWIDGDYHLKSEAGRWDPNSETWVIDANTSLCIDAGDPNDSTGIEPNPNGGRINIGVYGGTEQASKSPTGIIEPICTEYPAMDFNKDCKVDFQDFAKFAQSWLECNLEPPESCW